MKKFVRVRRMKLLKEKEDSMALHRDDGKENIVFSDMANKIR